MGARVKVKRRKSSALVEAERYIRDLERAAEALRLQNEVYRDRIRELEDRDRYDGGGLDS